ncbi:MAG TPA: lysophospholipid acyltransferase family protein, partial [Steroidobacteraceae bacterium]
MRALALAPIRVAYAFYAAITFLTLGCTALLAALILPGVYRRRAAARGIARAFLWVAGMPLTVRGMERLAPGQCIVVANHASYLDGLVFTAALPARFSFVIKREMSAVPLAGLFLRRIGSEFVERFDRNRGAADARRVLR